MIKSYSDWQRINEVDELTETTLTGKYINNIIQTYEKAPNIRPSRDVSSFPNAKSTQPLSTFVRGISNNTSAEIIILVMNNWYKWPDESKAKNVLFRYIKNDDDLSNLSGMGLPFGKVFQSDPILAIPSIKGIVKGTAKMGKGLFKMIPKLFTKESHIYRGKNERLNEDFGISALVVSILVGSLLSASTKYTLYGKESLQDDMLFSWTTPFLPDVQGVIGDDPILATYVSTFNTVMMMVYDSWNLCMGQEKYGEQKNPILDWQNAESYINAYYKQFYESDADIRPGFVSFMEELKQACLNDMKNPELFKNCPFYYTGEKVRINFENKDSISVSQGEWFKWLKDNYTKYLLVPVSKVEFNASERKEKFAPLSSLGVTDTPKGDPTRSITVQLPDGSITNLSLLELELYLLNSENSESFKLQFQDVTTGGSSVILENKEGTKPSEKEVDLPTTNPSIIQGSTLKQIATNIKTEELESFFGMGNV